MRERGLTCTGKKWVEAKYLDFKGKEKLLKAIKRRIYIF